MVVGTGTMETDSAVFVVSVGAKVLVEDGLGFLGDAFSWFFFVDCAGCPGEKVRRREVGTVFDESVFPEDVEQLWWVAEGLRLL